MASLKDLDGMLRMVQNVAGGTTDMRGLSWELSNNESLGFNKDQPTDFKVAMPYGTWPNDVASIASDTNFPSPLQASFKETLIEGSKDSSVCFIDLLSLNPASIFFTEPETKKGLTPEKALSLSHAIANVVNAVDPSKTPVIRFLCGTETTKARAAAWEEGDDCYKKRFEQMFWPNGEPLITHPKAMLHVGYYSPSFIAK
jgi:hypothetical protein